uniref:Putative secreted protein n=1 Tax=Anopheles triannulatus TaxID=58253 RepID=A0A2M4B4F9_9DIPT
MLLFLPLDVVFVVAAADVVVVAPMTTASSTASSASCRPHSRSTFTSFSMLYSWNSSEVLSTSRIEARFVFLP